MEIKDGKAYFSAASDWPKLLKWLQKKGKRPTKDRWAVDSKGFLVQNVEDILKNPPKPKFYSCAQVSEYNIGKQWVD